MQQSAGTVSPDVPARHPFICNWSQIRNELQQQNGAHCIRGGCAVGLQASRTLWMASHSPWVRFHARGSPRCHWWTHFWATPIKGECPFSLSVVGCDPPTLNPTALGFGADRRRASSKFTFCYAVKHMAVLCLGFGKRIILPQQSSLGPGAFLLDERIWYGEGGNLLFLCFSFLWTGSSSSLDKGEENWGARCHDTVCRSLFEVILAGWPEFRPRHDSW